MNPAEAAALRAEVCEIGEMLALGGLTAEEEAALNARMRELQDRLAPPLVVPAPAPAPAPARLSAREEREDLWRRLAAINSALKRDPADKSLLERLDRVARLLGLEEPEPARTFN